MSDKKTAGWSCAMCGKAYLDSQIFEGHTHRYVEWRGCCYDVEFYAPKGLKLDEIPYGEMLSKWPEDFQREVIETLNKRPTRPAVDVEGWTDTDRINFLDSLTKNGCRVILRHSEHGRGWRLHQSTRKSAAQSVRKAIDQFATHPNTENKK